MASIVSQIVVVLVNRELNDRSVNWPQDQEVLPTTISSNVGFQWSRILPFPRNVQENRMWRLICEYAWVCITVTRFQPSPVAHIQQHIKSDVSFAKETLR